MKRTNLITIVILSFIFAGCKSEPSKTDKDTQESQPVSNVPKNVISREIAPKMEFIKPAFESEIKYLGLDKREWGVFSLSDIKSQIVIIEVFSMYCPHCQKAAPEVNDLYKLIQSSGLSDKVKIIGVGDGNSGFEVERFKKAYNVPFPLFPDKDSTKAIALGRKATPHFFVIKIGQDGKNEIVYSVSGMFDSPEDFLGAAIKRSDLQ